MIQAREPILGTGGVDKGDEALRDCGSGFGCHEKEHIRNAAECNRNFNIISIRPGRPY